VTAYVFDTSIQIDPEQIISGCVEIAENQINFYKSLTDNDIVSKYFLIDMYFLDYKIIHTPNDIKKTTKLHMLDILSVFQNKYDKVIKEMTQDLYESTCLIYFGKKVVDPPLFNGLTKISHSVILCFPKINAEEIKTSFTKLLNQRYLNVIMKENELLKIQNLGNLYNMQVVYYTPFMQYRPTSTTTITPTYVNMNKNGVAFNKNDVSFNLILNYLN